MAQPVVDASPLIVLAKAGMLSLLRLAGDPVFVPQVVIQEVQQAGSNDPALQALTATSWLVSVDPGPVSPILSRYQLDAGEASVLTWALSHPGTEVIVDETRARRCAAQLGIALRGSVGLVLLAKQSGVLPLARPALEALRQAGLYLSDRVMNQALALVGE